MNLEEKCTTLLKRSLEPIPQELNEIDWKVMLSNKKDRLKKHLSAFSNLPGGGFLIFGVDDNGQTIGIDEDESRYIAAYLANIARTSLEPQINVKFLTFSYQTKSLLGVYIEECFEKPVHLKNKGIERSYIRAGGQSRLMSKEEIRQSVVSSRTLRFGEIQAMLVPEISENWDKSFDFSEIMKRLRPSGFSTDEEFKDFLFSLKLVQKTNDFYYPTNLAVLCAASDFENLHSYENLSIRMIEYKGGTKLAARRDKSFRAGYSLSLDQIISTLMDWLPYCEKINRATVIHEPLIPEIALREIIVNAIIHRDYTITNGDILIELFADRVEVTNPGGLLPEISIDRLIDHPSRTRNEVLSDFMRKLNFAEERGSGIDKAIISFEMHGLPPIKFYDGHKFFKVTMFSGKKFDNLTNDEVINAIFQHACLNEVIQRKTTGRSIRERFKLNRNESPKIYKLIEEAIKIGKVRLANPDASKRDQYYLPYWA